MTKFRALIAAPVFLLTVVCSGCLPFIVGGAVGALGGYAVSQDTIEGETDKDYNALWDAAKTVAGIRGVIKTEDETRGYMEMEVNSSRVIVQLLRLTKTTVRVKVSARNKLGLPNISLAEDIFVKILELAS